MKAGRFGWAVVVLGAGLGLAPAPSAEDVALVADGVKPEMFLVYTGDVIGYVDPCG
jgi:hypothetical protein